jgi:diguanylate cyclase (GGDEF)-like protein
MKANRRATLQASTRPASAVAAPNVAQLERQLTTLYAAIDNVESGMLILDRDLRVVYCNPTLLRMFKSAWTPENLRIQNPPYEELLQEVARNLEGRRFHYDRCQEAAGTLAVDSDDYVARRLEWARSGNPIPVELEMTSGQVLRCHMTALPEGGRMLVYNDVTDIIRHAQEQERLATTDGMTGIYNRRHFLTLADREWDRTRRYDRPLALLMLDIDYFKSINDTFGHQAGDEMIVHLANLARARMRMTDVLARIGGEEFALLVPETNGLQAQLIAERLRAEVAANPLVAYSGSIPATVSIGVAEKTAVMSDFLQLMSAADKALYEAKRAGRDRVICNVAPIELQAGLDDARQLGKTADCKSF